MDRIAENAGLVLGPFAGLSVYVVDDVMQTVVRTLRERFLSLPWRPWVRYKSVPMADPQVLRSDNSVYVPRSMWPAFQRGMLEATQRDVAADSEFVVKEVR